MSEDIGKAAMQNIIEVIQQTDSTTERAVKQYYQYGEITPCAICSYYQPFGGGYGRCTRISNATVTMKGNDFCSCARRKENINAEN